MQQVLGTCCMNESTNEWTQFPPTAADDKHSYSQKHRATSDPVRELGAPLQSLDQEVQQVVGEGQWQRMPCWTSEPPRPAGGPRGCIWGSGVSASGGRGDVL